MDTETRQVRSVRTLRIEIDKPSDEQRERWMRLAVASQEVNNLAWQFWLAWHVNNRSRAKLTAFLPTWKVWQETKEGDKPVWPVESLSAALKKQIRQFVNAEVPGLHSRAKDLQLTMTFDKIKNLKSLIGNKGGWISVVMGRQRPDQSIHPLPIRFDCQNATLLLPIERGGPWRLTFRADRTPKLNGKGFEATLDHVKLKRCDGSQQATLWKCIDKKSGWKWCGSSLAFRDGKWFALVAYSKPVESAGCPGELEASVMPSKSKPWRFLVIGARKAIPVGCSGRSVASMRRRLLLQRWDRGENYKIASSNRKGHGGKRARFPQEKFSKAWLGFTLNHNEFCTRKIVELCKEKGVGALTVWQPVGVAAGRMFLATAGKQDRDDATSWDWARFVSRLNDKCKDAGIVLTVKRCEQPPKQGRKAG